MKSKVVELVLVLLFLSAFVTGQAPLAREEAQSFRQSFAISEQGTLLELFDTNGKSKFGKISHDGFDLTYETTGKKMAVSAIGTQSKGLQAGEVKSDGASAAVSVKTKDEALEITSYFTFDEKANELIIGRKIRNLSQQPVTLLKVRDYVASTLTGGKVAGNINLPKSDTTDCYPNGVLRKCVPPPCPGRTCPSEIKATNYLALEWKEIVKLAPLLQALHGNTIGLELPENEAYIIVHVRLK